MALAGQILRNGILEGGVQAVRVLQGLVESDAELDKQRVVLPDTGLGLGRGVGLRSHVDVEA